MTFAEPSIVVLNKNELFYLYQKVIYFISHYTKDSFFLNKNYLIFFTHSFLLRATILQTLIEFVFLRAFIRQLVRYKCLFSTFYIKIYNQLKLCQILNHLFDYQTLLSEMLRYKPLELDHKIR